MLRRPVGAPSLPSKLRKALRERGAAGTLRLLARGAVLRGRRLYDELREWRFDRRLGVDTRGILYHAAGEQETHQTAGPYQGVRERRFARALASLGVDPGGFTFIDLGCGKGKALLLAAQAGFPKVVGVDFEPELCRAARANLERYAGGIPVEFEVLTQDAGLFEFPPEPTVLFLYNPFQEGVMRTVMANLERSLREHPRELSVIYMNAQLAAVLDDLPFLQRLAEGPDYVIYERRAA